MFKRGAAAVAVAAVLVALALEVVAQTAQPSAPPAASPAVTPPDKGNMRFQHLDTNHDGKLSREECARSRFLSKHFDEIDTNHDGFITPDEKRAAWKLQTHEKMLPHASVAKPPATAVSATQPAVVAPAVAASGSSPASNP